MIYELQVSLLATNNLYIHIMKKENNHVIKKLTIDELWVSVADEVQNIAGVSSFGLNHTQ